MTSEDLLHWERVGISPIKGVNTSQPYPNIGLEKMQKRSLEKTRLALRRCLVTSEDLLQWERVGISPIKGVSASQPYPNIGLEKVSSDVEGLADMGTGNVSETFLSKA